MSMKNPLTPAVIELVTFRFVAQHLNHCATAVPFLYRDTRQLIGRFEEYQDLESG